MNVKYDKTEDAKYICIKRGKISKTAKIKDWLFFDYAKNGDVLGIEILNASKNLVSVLVDSKNLVQYEIFKNNSKSCNKKGENFGMTLNYNKELKQISQWIELTT